jgi:haloacid dehalogenase-like hydrolase
MVDMSRRTSLSTLTLLPAVSSQLLSVSAMAQTSTAGDPLTSWNDGATKKSITDFVSRVIKSGGPDYVAPEERVAAFDNDGTLWAEQPMYFQLAFVCDRVKTLAPQHPEWITTQPFKAILENDLAALSPADEKGMVELVAATHSGMTTDEFTKIVMNWLATARHPPSSVHTPSLFISRWWSC